MSDSSTFSLHIMRMCPILNKFNPEYSNKLREIFETKLIKYQLLDHLIHNIDKYYTGKILAEFVKDEERILYVIFKELHDSIFSNYCMRAPDIDGGYSLFNHSSDIIIYEHDYAKNIIPGSAVMLASAIPIFADKSNIIDDGKYYVIFDAKVIQGKNIDTVAQSLLTYN